MTDVASGMAAAAGLFSYGWGATKQAATVVSEKINETGVMESSAVTSTKQMVAPVFDKTVEIAVAAKDGTVAVGSDLA